MPLNLSTTRRFVRLMIKRRPSLRFSSTAQGNLAGRRSFYRQHTGVQIYNSTAYVGARTPSAHSQNLFRRRGTSGQVHGSTGGRVYASSLKIAEEGQYSGTETTTDDTLEITDLNLDDFSWSSRGQSTSATSKPRILRSYRYRKSKSVDAAALSLLRMKEGEGTSSRHIHTWPTKTTRSIEWTLLSANSSELDGSSRVPSDQHDTAVPSECGAYSLNYVTAPPTFHASTPRAGLRVLQAVDRHTGIVFDRVCQGGVSSDANLQGFSSDLSYQLVSTTSGPSSSSSFAEVDEFAKPSMVLTVPTPIPPQSPVFIPQSPITVFKFFDALDEETLAAEFSAGVPETSSMSQSPLSLGLCGECGLFEFEHGLQCRDCDRRWLACKVWYRAQDGGRKRWLNTPYIRPGESNAHNRALMHGLGVPGCRFSTENMVEATWTDCDRPPARVRKTVRRMRRFVASRAVHAKHSFFVKTTILARQGAVKVHVVSRPACRTFKRAAGSLGLGYIWRRLSGTWLVSSTDDVSTHDGSHGDSKSGEHHFQVPDTTV